MMDEYREFKTISKNLVDGEPWYTIACSRAVSAWIKRTFPPREGRQWFHHTGLLTNYNIVDVDERIYTMLVLRWL
jgi:hypothetical protein